VAHRGRFGSLFQVVICRDLYAYPCFFCCNYFASAADVRTHILADHINQPFKITIKKEESSNDDDDGKQIISNRIFSGAASQ
jgi:hypothetical protein